MSALLAVGQCNYVAPLAYASYQPYNTALTYTSAPAAPVAYASAPAVAAPVAPVAYAPAAAPYVGGSQFHAQDEFGNLQYGYNNINSVKHEVGNTYGGVSGGYSYVDAAGALQTVQYVADAAGFRTVDSRLPVAPTFNPEPLVAPTFNPEPLVAPTFNPEPLVAPVFDGVAPEPVQDTPEVVEARAAHLAAVAEANKPAKREAEPAVLAGASRVLTPPTPLVHNPPVHHPVAPFAPLHPAGYLGYGYPGLF